MRIPMLMASATSTSMGHLRQKGTAMVFPCADTRRRPDVTSCSRETGRVARLPFGPEPVKTSAGALPFLNLRPQAQQRIFSSYKLAPCLIQPLLLALNEAAIRRNGLVDPAGRLLQLQMYLASERVLEMRTKLGY